MRDEERVQRSPVLVDWDAAAWSLTEVFNAFLLPQWEAMEGRIHDIIRALNRDAPSASEGAFLSGTHQALRELIKRDNVTIEVATKLHPAVWLRLLHFVGERAGVRFTLLAESYCQWRTSHGHATLFVKRQNPQTRKWRTRTVDIFLLQDISELDLKVTYKWTLDTKTDRTVEQATEITRAKVFKKAVLATEEARMAKIGKQVCRNVAEMLAHSDCQRIPGLSPMRFTVRAKASHGETRKYQYQGKALTLATYLKKRKNSPVSRRSDEIVAKAVRLYVKCS
ncbi:hypothetical protein YS110_00040 [Acidovorax sp. YS12]|nr:hypothetical protein YS110_00040 [Acidovorax sp. YS12]